MAPAVPDGPPPARMMPIVVCLLAIFGVQLTYGLELPDPQQNVMPFEPVRYSKPNLTENYRSSTKFNARGMGHLYLITKKFMDLILEDEPYPEDFFAVENDKVVVKGEWEKLGFHYGWLVLVGGCGLILGAAVPLVGLVFCCCRCAGRCGARTQPFDKRYDTCRRHFFALLLSVVTVLIMFGVVCTFVTNESMEEGAQNFPKNVRTSLQDFQLYLNNTKKEVNNLLVTNFEELDNVLNRLLHRSGEIVKDKLGEVSKAAVLANLTTIVSGLRTIRTDLHNIDSLTRQLQEDAMILEAALKESRQTLLERLRLCRNERPCMEFLARYNITSLSIEANFTQLPDVTSSLQNVSALLTDGIEKEVLKGQEQFDRIKFSIQKSVDRIIPEISKEINKGGKTLKAKASDVTQVLDKIQNWVDRIPQPKVDQGEVVLRKYTNYRYDFGLGVSCLVLTVLCSLSFGLFCGYCGKRPDHYSDDCCDKGTASRFLMLGVWLMFISCSILIAVIVLFMVTGSVADRLVCQTLRNPQNSQTFNFVEDLFELKDLYDRDPPINLSSILVECHKNSSIYKTLGLDLGSMSSKYAEQFNIPERVRQLANSIVLNADIVIITPEAQKQLRALAASPLNNIDLTVYTSVLNDRITSIDLLQMAVALNQTAMKLPPNQANVKSFLLTKAMYLEVHQERQVAVMGRLAGELHGNATLLSQHLRFNHSSLRHAVDTLLSALNQAQHTLTTKGPRIVQQLAADFGREFGIHIDNYLERVESEAYHSVGKCWPVSQAFNATVVATCNNFIDPFNGFWLSIGWIVLLYIPALVLSIKLASLYQKSDPYPGALTEAEYLYDTYADRDNIPLANMGSGGGVGVRNDKKKKKKKGGRGYEGGGAFSSHLGRNERGGSRSGGGHPPPPHDDRQWEFSGSGGGGGGGGGGGTGGPPRYQSPPLTSEYERPPPYYYPGPTQ